MAKIELNFIDDNSFETLNKINDCISEIIPIENKLKELGFTLLIEIEPIRKSFQERMQDKMNEQKANG